MASNYPAWLEWSFGIGLCVLGWVMILGGAYKAVKFWRV